MLLSYTFRVMTAVLYGTLRGITGAGWKKCVLCSHKIPAFLPWRGGFSTAPPIIQALHMVGSDIDHFACPRCGSTDRERHLYLYLTRTGIANSFCGKRVLHFAPEYQLSTWISSLEPSEYILGDLFPSTPPIQKINIEAIPFPDGYFDYLIANHVLEHVANLTCAISEITRVLNINGIAILQTPWCKKLSKTIEDQAVIDPYSRLHLFGQEDHVRIFGQDIYTVLSNENLIPSPIAHNDILHDINQDYYGVNIEEDFMIFQRK